VNPGAVEEILVLGLHFSSLAAIKAVFRPFGT
jgi:hypothetical protein